MSHENNIVHHHTLTIKVQELCTVSCVSPPELEPLALYLFVHTAECRMGRFQGARAHGLLSCLLLLRICFLLLRMRHAGG